MSLLLNADYIARNLRIALLKSEDKPSERIVEISPPRAPPNATSDYDVLDYYDHAICEYLYQGKEAFTYSHSPPISLQNDYSLLKKATGSSSPWSKSPSIVPNSIVLPSSTQALPPTRRSSLGVIRSQEELSTRRANDLQKPPGDQQNRTSVILEEYPDDFEVDDDGYEDDDVKKRPSRITSRNVSRRPSEALTGRENNAESTDTLSGQENKPPRTEQPQPVQNAKNDVALHPTAAHGVDQRKNQTLAKEVSKMLDRKKSSTDLLFVKKPIPKSPQTSALSLMIGSKGSMDNPFASAYSRFSGKGEQNPIRLQIYCPFSNQPQKPLTIIVKRDASVEDAIGFTLYQYAEEKREPRLDRHRTNLANWSMRIVEDDGTIDEDFPALERTRKIQKFAFEHFALCEAGQASVIAPPQPAPTPTPPPKINAPMTYFLKVHLYSTIEIRHTTTLSVSTNMLMSEVLEMVCKKRNVESKDYLLKLMDMKSEVGLDKTVESLKGATELILVKKSMGVSAGDVFIRPPGEESPPPSPRGTPYVSSSEYSTAYKKYMVIRKMPMFIGRSERILAIDGEYIHLIPPENRQFFDTVKTSSYHITSVMSCKQNKKVPTNFRLVVIKDSRENKNYDFEAMSAAEAGSFIPVFQLRCGDR